MNRIGIPDGSGGQRNMRCPGAALILDRAGFRELEKAGMPFSSNADDIPAEGKGWARAFCRNDVATVQRHHGLYPMGLCTGCSELEANQRADLRAKATKVAR